MSKTIIFELTTTLKAGKNVYLKGSTFNEETFPPELKADLDAGSKDIQIKSFGDYLEGTTFDPDSTITVKEPKRKLKAKPKKRIGS